MQNPKQPNSRQDGQSEPFRRYAEGSGDDVVAPEDSGRPTQANVDLFKINIHESGKKYMAE
jgi:hypothetical protein